MLPTHHTACEAVRPFIGTKRGFSLLAEDLSIAETSSALSLLSVTSSWLMPAALTDAVSGIADPFIGAGAAAISLVEAVELYSAAARTFLLVS